MGPQLNHAAHAALSVACQSGLLLFLLPPRNSDEMQVQQEQLVKERDTERRPHLPNMQQWNRLVWGAQECSFCLVVAGCGLRLRQGLSNMSRTAGRIGLELSLCFSSLQARGGLTTTPGTWGQTQNNSGDLQFSKQGSKWMQWLLGQEAERLRHSAAALLALSFLCVRSPLCFVETWNTLRMDFWVSLERQELSRTCCVLFRAANEAEEIRQLQGVLHVERTASSDSQMKNEGNVTHLSQGAAGTGIRWRVLIF